MPNKQQVIDANRLHPDWTSKQIAIAIIGINEHWYAVIAEADAVLA